ncbi:MAG TPA: tetratricopeptide repeat protein [Anaeromyxobacteraceae bacterium]|nr:tetratricopeptide repeat protein [Anaeromyxobacteraceae bacterium]
MTALALCLLLLAAGPPARAAAPAGAPLEVMGKKRSAVPDEALAGSLEARGATPAAGRPALAFDAFRHQVEVEVAGKRREEMSGLEELLRLGGAEAELPGWLFRLGELHWEEAQHLFFEANRRDDELLRAGAGSARARALAAEKRDLEARSRREQEAAVARYLELVRRFPQWGRMDEVLFFLGENFSRQQRAREASAAYRRLLTRFPQSRFVPDAWVALGEYWFDEAEKGDRARKLGAAREAYRRAAAHQESSVRGYALYKQGWVEYNLGDFRAALALFEQVVRFGDGDGGGTGIAAEKRLALGREARRDYVRTYSHVGQPQAAEREFARVGGGDGREMLRQLAQLYYDEGKDRESILVHHRLIQRWPGAVDAPLFQSRIVTGAGRLGRKELAVQQAGKFVDLVRAAERSGAAAGERQQEVLASARREAENTLRTLAVQYHNEWKKTREPATAELAADLYRDHLALFPEGPRAYEMRFFHAELLFALGRFQEAGDAYARVVALDPSARGRPPGRWLADALEGAVFAYDAALKGAGGATAAPGQPLPHGKRPYTREEQQLLDACLRYAERAPRGEKAVEAAYQAAQLRYRHDELKEAARLFAAIALEHPRHPLAGYAANLLLDAENLLGDVRATGEWARRLYEKRELLVAHPELEPDLVRVVEQSAFKLVEQEEKAGRHGEAARSYLAFATDWPESGLAATALFDAAVDFARAGDLPRAMAARRALWDRHPGHPLAAKALLSSGADAAALADFGPAADAYERYFAGWKAEREAAARRPRKSRGAAPASRFDERSAQDALHDAGIYREGLGQLRRAEADRKAFVAAFPQAKETPRVFRSLASIYERQREPGRAARHLQEYQRRFARAGQGWFEAQQWLARLHEQAGDPPAARRDRAVALRRWRESGGGAGDAAQALAAAAMVDELDRPFEDYGRIGFAVPARRLAAQVSLKGKRLLELQQRYTAVVKLEAAEPAVCALARIGEGYRGFAEALLQAPVPPELRREPELAKEYRAQLSAQAAAPRQKAVEGLALAVTQARAHGVANDCARRAEAALRALDPEAAAPAPERVPWPPFDAPAPGAPRAEGEPPAASASAADRVRLGLSRLEAGDAEAAFRLGHEAVAKDPAVKGGHSLLMRASLARGELDLARLLALEAAKVDPADPYIPLVEGRVLERRGDANGALATWRRAASGRSGALLERELLRLSLSRERWTEVARAAGVVLAASPKDAAGQLALGVARRHLGKPAEALAAYAEAEKLAGDSLPEVHLARAVLLAQDRKECDAARAELGRYTARVGPIPPAQAARLLGSCDGRRVASSQATERSPGSPSAASGKAP